MLHVCVTGNTLPEAYHKALCQLSGVSDQEIALALKVVNPFQEPRISRLWPGGPRELEQYRLEMLDGILDFEVEEGLWHYTYHQRYSKWLKFVIDELKRDPNSRRAVISVRDNELDAGNDNPACLQSIQFLIRNNKLHMFVMFRSNDAVRASFMNMFALTELQKKVADILGIEIGTYTHYANSYHVYDESVPTLNAYVRAIFDYKRETTYNYKGHWDSLMAAERESIFEMVKQQKEKAGI